MKLNKSTSFTLLHLLGGAKSAAKIAEQMPAVNIRSIQRALVRLDNEGLVKRHGITNPKYALEYEQILKQPIQLALLENMQRPDSSFNFGMLEWLLKRSSQNVATMLSPRKAMLDQSRPITKRELEHWTVELSWKSSALEGNTYTLLDTKLLLVSGMKAKDKTSFETQMILNHQQAIAFIIENPELFTDRIAFAAVEEIHKHISYNLGIETGIRKRPVKISASHYEPIANPSKLRECGDSALLIISREQDPFIKALLAFSLLPYLQLFEDGNKRIGRMLANAVLIHSIGRGISLKNVDAKQLALAYLSFYEFNSLNALSKILQDEIHS